MFVSNHARVALLLAGVFMLLASEPIWAHEGHAALPSTGATVDGDQLLLSPAAVKAIGLKTQFIQVGELRHELRVNARLELPSTEQALVTTLTSAKGERLG